MSNFCQPHTAEWLKDLFNNSPDALFVQDMDARILAANRAMERLTGRKEEELKGIPVTDLMPAEWRERWQHDLNMLTAGKWDAFESHISNSAEKRVTPVEAVLIAEHQMEGRPAIMLHLHNTSVFYNVEKALMASQEQWELSFDAITDCMCILNGSGHILRVNQSMKERFQSMAGDRDLCGLHHQNILQPSPHAPEHAMPDPLRQAPFSLEKTAFAGIEGWFSAAAYPLEYPGNRTAGFLLVLRDITSQLQTEVALQKSEAGLRQAAKMEAIGRLAGGVAHDFNNMLTSMLGYSSMIMKSLPTDSVLREDVQEIVRAAERATALTRQLLNFSHDRAIETQVMNINASIVNLATFLKHTLGGKIQLETRLDPLALNINADTSRMEQILVNLAINAKDAMPDQGQLIIETRKFTVTKAYCTTHPNLTPGDYALLEVSDTGQGMPPNVLEHIFEPFFTTKPSGKGTGLGLTTIYGIVKQFGGTIQCYSEIKKGTTFKIFLPLAEGEPQAAASETKITELPRGNETILVVDDETNIVNMINQILTELGYKVLPSSSCREALHMSANHPGTIDLVLTDIIMPDMNGTELVGQLRLKRPEIKALYMSGYANNAAMQISGLAPDAVLMQKPFSFDTMAKRIRKALA